MWIRIETIAHEFFARQKLRNIIKSNADRVAQYRAIAGTSQETIRQIEKLRYHDIALTQIKPWLDGNIRFADATEEFLNKLNIAVTFDRKIERALKGLLELVEAANEAADEVHKGRGRPDGTSLLSQNHTFELAEIYKSNAGQGPIKGAGAADFIQQFLIAAGEENATKKDSGFEGLKYVRRKAKKKGRP